jgi:radical SAM superfamily enzyme YgiQ (UPF0313 family)
MILNCTLPYKRDMPNPALGYLKGFLQAQGIEVKNVYWNAVLSRKIDDLYRGLGRNPRSGELFPLEEVTLYVFRQLMGTDDHHLSGIGALLLSSFTRRELSEAVASIKDTIDWYIKKENLHEGGLTGFTLKFFQWPMSFYMINRLKELNPDIKVVIGGIDDESQAAAFMRALTQADYAIYGEGEYPLTYLVKALEEGTDLNQVPQLVYREGTAIVKGAPPVHCPPLDGYPFADHTDYFGAVKEFMGISQPVIIPIWGSRSCNWNKCKFCVLNRGYEYRSRSPEHVVQELEFQSKKHKSDTFMFVDTDVVGNKKRFRKLLKLLAESVWNRKKPYQLFAEISPIFIDSETAKSMKLASFAQVQVGFEALTDSLLQKMRKRQKFAHNIQVLKYGSQYGLDIGGLNVIKGIPTETEEDVMENIANLKFLRFFFDKYHLNPIPLVLAEGSPFYEEMPEEDRKSWKESLYWLEVAPTGLIPESDRFELFGFQKNGEYHRILWRRFESILTFFTQLKCSYEWIEYKDGSLVEEKGIRFGRYALDRDETDILIYCDSIKTFSNVKERFSHLSEDKILEMMGNLKNGGLLYYDKDLRTIISVLEAERRKTAQNDV